MKPVNKLYRHEIRYFKPNEQIKNNNGIFIYRLNDKMEYSVDVIHVDNNIKFANELERYKEYDKYINDKDSTIMIIEYFEVSNEKGEDADVIYNLTKQELEFYIENKIIKPTKENCKNL